MLNRISIPKSNIQKEAVIKIPRSVNEESLKEEFKCLNQSASGFHKPLKDFCQIAAKYPSATTVVNFTKNRYKDVLPEELTRVKLNPVKGEEGSDYINANHIFDQYISCQAPLPHTFDTFWRMVWEQRVSVICMLTKVIENSKQKADVYWPMELLQTVSYGDFKVTLQSVNQSHNYIDIRTFELTHNQNSSETRKIVHIHYTEWPDFGVPCTTETIRRVIEEVEVHRATGRIIAHCSAGIGRTGAFFGILLALHKLRTGACRYLDELDIKEIVESMRRQRAGMVQTDEQYIFIFRVLRDLINEEKRSPRKVKLEEMLRLSSSNESTPEDSQNLLNIHSSLDELYPSTKAWKSRKHASGSYPLNSKYVVNSNWKNASTSSTNVIGSYSFDDSLLYVRKRCATAPDIIPIPISDIPLSMPSSPSLSLPLSAIQLRNSSPQIPCTE